MTWIYHQYSGELYHDDKLIDRGYSGKGFHKNNPASESLHGLGPIPRGRYTIGSYTDSKGPLTIILEPSGGNQMYGRDAFRIHGDSKKEPGNASEGCIIVGRHARQEIVSSTDRELVVQ
ncbi:tlde1 domain-containing protein [Kalamiella sp. sgz302252]|uniref:tlde1 domain-containing protein n=1 Tax=Pantoea sp. sgz302252 TaxID=3341827 RepID=UPI0036D30BB8